MWRRFGLIDQEQRNVFHIPTLNAMKLSNGYGGQISMSLVIVKVKVEVKQQSIESRTN
jgi:hypothetical protein